MSGGLEFRGQGVGQGRGNDGAGPSQEEGGRKVEWVRFHTEPPKLQTLNLNSSTSPSRTT